MEKLLQSWLKRPVTFFVLNIVVITLGAGALWNLPVELTPNLSFPKLIVSSYYPDATPEMVEALITAPIESRVQQIPGVRSISSVSRKNSSRVEMTFDRDSDMDYMRFLLNEMLAGYKTWLPQNIGRPQIISYIPDELEKEIFISYRLLSDLPESRLYAVLEDDIKRPLLGIPGVGGVELSGVREPVIEVVVDQNKMQQHGITLTDVRRVTGYKDENAGIFQHASSRIPVIVKRRFKNLQEIRALPLKASGSRVIRLGEVARVTENHPPLRVKKRINGFETVLITLHKESYANTVAVADAVFEKAKQIKSVLPDNTSLLLVDDASAKIRTSLSELSKRSLIAVLAILFLLAVGMRSIKAGAIIVVSIAVSFLAVFWLLYVLEYSVNLLTLAGLALGFGFLVDNAILIYDNIDRENNRKETAVAVREMAAPLTAATLTTLAAIAPFVFLTGDLQIYYLPFAIVIAITLLASVFFSLLYIPAAYTYFIKRPPSKKETTRPKTFYLAVLSRLLKRRKTVTVVFILLAGLPLWLLPQNLETGDDDAQWAEVGKAIYNHTLGSAFYLSMRDYSDAVLGGVLYLFFNKVDRGKLWRWHSPTYLYVSLRLPQGSAPGLSDHNIREFESLALEEEGVARTESTIWPSGARLRIDFDDEHTFSAVPYVLKEKLIARAAGMSGLIVSVSGYGDGFSGGMIGSDRATFYLDFRGYNYKELESQVVRFKRLIEKNRRVRDVDINARYGYSIDDLYYLNLLPQKEYLARHEISLSTVLADLRLKTSEYLAYDRIVVGRKEKRLRVKAAGFENFNTDQLLRSPFPRAEDFYRFNHFVSLSKMKSGSEVRRENQQYIRKVSFDFLGPYRFARQFLDKSLEEFAMPVGYSIDRRSLWSKEEESSDNLFLVIALGLVFVYIVTAGLYESFRDPLLIFLTIPAGFIGIVWIFFMLDSHFGHSAYIGAIFISGIVVNNSILLLSRFKRYLQDGRDLISAIRAGVSDHLRPITLTTLTTITGFLPLVLLSSVSSENLWFSLALAGIGGIASSYVFILFCLPVLFYLVEGKRNR